MKYSGSNDSTSSVTVSENRCSLRTSLYPLSTSCGEMEAPCRHPKAQENLESSIPERKAEQGLGLSDQRKPDVMVAPTVQDLPLEDEAMQSHLEHPNIKMQAPQFLKRSFSEPVLGQRDSQLPHPLRHSRRPTYSLIQRGHGQALARRSAAWALVPRRKSAPETDTCRQETRIPVHIACCRIYEGPDDHQIKMMHLWLEQYEYVERRKLEFYRDYYTQPNNEGSQGVAPSDTAAPVVAGGATVRERNSPEVKASEQQDKKHTTAAQQPEGLPERTLVESSSVVPWRRLPQGRPFRPQAAHAEMTPRQEAAEHTTPRPETPPVLCRNCCAPALLCHFIQNAGAKLRAASMALYSLIRKATKKLSKKGREPIVKNRPLEQARLDTDQRRSRRSLSLLAKKKNPRTPQEAMRKDMVASQDKTFSDASEARGAKKALSQGGSSHRHLDVLAPVARREPANVLLPRRRLLLETEAPAPSQSVLADVQAGTAAVSSGLLPDATRGQKQKGKGHTQDKSAPPRRKSPKKKESSSEQRPSGLPQPPNPTGTNVPVFMLEQRPSGLPQLPNLAGTDIPISLLQELFTALRDLKKARQTADELQKQVLASFSNQPTNNAK